MKPKHITIHCSATRDGQRFTVDDIRKMHTDKGWSDIGYHFYIDKEGAVHTGRPLSRTGAHVKGHNTDNIGICLEGGLDKEGNPDGNTFESHQLDACGYLVQELAEKYNIPAEEIKGHRDWFGDTNGDGVIDEADWLKVCPCIEISDMLEEWDVV